MHEKTSLIYAICTKMIAEVKTMLFSELALAIGQEYICGDPHVAAEMEVTDISLLGGETGSYAPGTLYIGQLSQLKNPSFPPNLIFWGEGEPRGWRPSTTPVSGRRISRPCSIQPSGSSSTASEWRTNTP